MTDLIAEGSEPGSRLPIEALPKTALQAIYHAVTGKTERYSKRLKGNVFIRAADIDNLFHALCQQIEHYDVLAAPTVTVEVKTADSKNLQYSSWERFNAIRVNAQDITSEFSIKIEFIATLPNTSTPQRCVVNINLDSSLPIISSEERRRDIASFPFLIVMNHDWQTVNINIDFVDFLIARNFVSIIEDWFKHLSKTPVSKLNNFLIRNQHTINSILGNSGRAGAGLFITAYVMFDGSLNNPVVVANAAAVLLIVWAIFNISRELAGRSIQRRISANLLPSIILLTEGDDKAYRRVLSESNSPFSTTLRIFGILILNVSLNLAASYIYSYLTKPI